MTPDRLWSMWNLDAWLAFGLATAAWLYARGARTLWRRAGPGRGVRVWQVAAFEGGLAIVAVALLSPLDGLADGLFAAHMVQHLLLIAAAAPLMGLGEPLLVYAWALRGARMVVASLRVARAPAHWLSRLPVAFGVHSAAVWLWHVPVLYEAALRSTGLHALEHATLLGSGVVVWSAVWAGFARTGRAGGARAVVVAGLGVQCSLLGALITFAAQPWYPLYGGRSAAWGVSAADDQVLAGVLMWIPGGLLYLALGMVLLTSALRPDGRADGSGERWQHLVDEQTHIARLGKAGEDHLKQVEA